MIVTVTMAPGVDLVYEVDGCLSRGAVSRARISACSRRWFAAGKGINVARGVRDLGHAVLALAPGGGVGGRLLAELMREEGLAGEVVDASCRIRVNATMGSADEELHIVEQSTSLSPGDLEAFGARVIGHLDGCSTLVISGHCPPPHGGQFVLDLLEVARARSIRTIVDTRSEALQMVARGGRPWLLKPNNDELSELAGVALHSDADVLETSRQVLESSGATFVLASLGGRGALLVGHHGSWRAAAPAAPVVNTVGAGDAMVAAVAVSSPDVAPPELLCRAVAAGTANVGVAAPGAVPPDTFPALREKVCVEQVG